MIVTITPNPSLDRSFEMERLVHGRINRAETERVDPGGKGVNVSLALKAAGHPTTAVLPLGGYAGELLADMLGDQGVTVVAVPVAGATRVNVSVVEAGALTKINTPGPEITARESAALLAAVAELNGPDTDWLACCGSLPQGLELAWYADLVSRAHAGGARIALDTSGSALLAALPARPDVIKPNREELAEAVGRPLATLGDAVKAADELRALGARQVLASLGADGMLLVSEEGTWYATAPVVAVRSDVGAGDASLAGFLGAGGGGPAALAAAVAYGAAAVTLPGSALPTPADLDPAAVTVTADLPLDRPLGGGPDGTEPSGDRARPKAGPAQPRTDLAHLKHLKGSGVRARVQRLGGYLAGMVMPNLGAFIAWGLITAMFIPTGWLPDASLARLVDPMITYLLPVLIGYTGGRLVHGQRGAVVGAVATLGVAVGSDVPMFLGAMIVGPLTAYLLKLADGFTARRTRPGFEMLVDNFSAGIVGGAMAIVGLRCVGPVVSTLTRWAGHGVRDLVNAHLLPLVSVIVEPAKVLFLNNAINHGVLAPLGVEQAGQSGKSVLFMIESNPGPGLGILLAYLLFGPRRLRATVPGAIIVQFLGGIHEIYFPYVLMKPRLVLAAIAGGMTGVATATVTHAGLVATPSPGSIFAYLAVTPRGGYFPVLASVAAAAAVSFTTGAALLRTSRVPEPEAGPAPSATVPPGNAAPATARPSPVPLDAVAPEAGHSGDTRSVTASAVSNVVVACDAGMGSSVMLAGQLTRRLKPYGVTATHTPVNDIPQGTQVVVTHANLADRARSTVPDAVIIPFRSFLNDPAFDLLEAAFRDGGEIRA